MNKQTVNNIFHKGTMGIPLIPLKEISVVHRVDLLT